MMPGLEPSVIAAAEGFVLAKLQHGAVMLEADD
jgi:hypothetical protein